jgi:hypothetical protein
MPSQKTTSTEQPRSTSSSTSPRLPQLWALLALLQALHQFSVAFSARHIYINSHKASRGL